MRLIDADAFRRELDNHWPFTKEEQSKHGIADMAKSTLLEVLHNMSPIELPHWIPCSERLPEEENKSYWICTDGGYQCECRWTNVNHFWTNLTTDWYWHIMDVPRYSKVVAWMPLPKPYGGGSDV